jgi:hypothetical protein
MSDLSETPRVANTTFHPTRLSCRDYLLQAYATPVSIGQLGKELGKLSGIYSRRDVSGRSPYPPHLSGAGISRADESRSSLRSRPQLATGTGYSWGQLPSSPASQPMRRTQLDGASVPSCTATTRPAQGIAAPTPRPAGCVAPLALFLMMSILSYSLLPPENMLRASVSIGRSRTPPAQAARRCRRHATYHPLFLLYPSM